MLQKAGVVILVAVAVALVAPPASPVQVSYVTSDSMEPAIGTGDGYVLVPPGEVIPGEIVTFYSEEREGYVTHRVAGTTTGGYITKGDANPSTDQATGSPPVDREAIAGQVLAVGGQPVLIPQLGTAIGLVRTHWVLLFGLGAILLVVRTLRGGKSTASQATKQSVYRSKQLIVPALVLGIVASTLLVSMGAVHSDFTYSVTETGGENARQLPVDEETTVSIRAEIPKTPVTGVLVETENMTVINTTQKESAAGPNATGPATGTAQSSVLDRIAGTFLTSSGTIINAEIPAQTELEAHTVGISLYPYPATLPRGALEWLHGIHPVVAAFSSVAVGFVPGYVVYWLLLDPATPLRGSRRRWLHRLGER
jgi:signal peptidase